MVDAAPPQQKEKGAAPKTTVLANVVAKATAVVVVVGLSLVVHAYRRTLVPLYGVAPVDLHLNKIVWAACIIGSFAPTVPVSYATLVTGVLLCLMPNTAYWAAVYTGRMGDPVWGPVYTHLAVALPLLATGVAVVKSLQHSAEEEASPQQMITLPIVQTSIMTLQELWAVAPYIKELTEATILLQLGSAVLATWAISPLLASTPEEIEGLADVPASESDKPAEKEKKTAKKVPSQPPKGTRAKIQHRRKPSTKAATSETAEAEAKPSPKTVLKPLSTNQKMARLVLIPILPFLTATILRPPTLPQPLSEPYIHPTYPLRILSSERSRYSGVVVVGEALPPTPDKPSVADIHSLRYLRAGHSLLGGAWIGDLATKGREPDTVAKDEAGELLGEPMYDAFVLQEAVRLAEKPDGGVRKNALVLGLGAGTSTSALMQHNISTTIVELDPVVYSAAKRFFALPEPEPGRLFLEDAWAFLRKQQVTDDRELYDIVVHDVFSGGSLPASLFTQQFWNHTKRVMSPDGVLAVNFAGNLKSKSSQAILYTLELIFGPCRAFYDGSELQENAADVFHNWVLFCSTSSSPLTFRTAVTSDYLGSTQRQSILSTLAQREVDLVPIRESISEKDLPLFNLTDGKNALGRWQAEEAVGHWKIMRQVLPDVFWETY